MQVMLVDLPLNGKSNLTELPDHLLPYPEVTQFLTKHSTAKILVVVDTHCLQENGALLWEGNDSQSYGACPLWQVSQAEHD
jgi:hypothetical protein